MFLLVVSTAGEDMLMYPPAMRSLLGANSASLAIGKHTGQCKSSCVRTTFTRAHKDQCEGTSVKCRLDMTVGLISVGNVRLEVSESHEMRRRPERSVAAHLGL